MKKTKNKKGFKKIWIKYLIYFTIFSFIGSLLEYLSGILGGQGIPYDKSIYQFFHIKLFFIPFYGLGGVILILFEEFMEEHKTNFFLRGLLNGIIIVAWEFIGGVSTLIVLGEKFWDYSGQPYNFLGIISLQSFLIWTLLGYIFALIYKYIINNKF